MADYTTFTGNTKQEAEAKAQHFIKTLDPYRQPEIYSSFQHISGEWRVTVLSRGLD